MSDRAGDRIKGGVHQIQPHDSAAKHVSGAALYVDDLPEPPGLLHVYLGTGSRAHARIRRLDLDSVQRAPGVALVLTAKDIPGENDASPLGTHDEPLLAQDVVEFAGQPLFGVAATTRDAARRAARLAAVEYEPLEAVLDLESARQRGVFVAPPHRLRRGDAAAAIAAAP